MTNSCENVFLFMPRNDFIRSKCGLKKFYSIHMLLFVQFKSLFTFERLNNFKTQVWKINSTKETCLDFLKTLFSRIVWFIFQNLKKYVFSCFYQVSMIVTFIVSLPFLGFQNYYLCNMCRIIWFIFPNHSYWSGFHTRFGTVYNLCSITI